MRYSLSIAHVCFNITTMRINIKKLNPQALLPVYNHEGDAGMDMFALEATVVPARGRALVSTGIAMEIPLGFVGLFWGKSGLATKHGIVTSAGVIDAGYRGEVKIALVNTSDEDYTIEAGHKVAQLLIQKIEHPEIVEVSELSETVRGEQGFGSTGK